MLVNAIEALTNEVEQLNTEISSLNQGQIWSGTLVDAINEVANALNEEPKQMTRREFFKMLIGKK